MQGGVSPPAENYFGGKGGTNKCTPASFRYATFSAGACHPKRSKSCMKQTSVSKTAFALFFFCSLLFSRAAHSQDFSSIDNDLQTLENLIIDTIANTEEQQRLLEDLRANLNESWIKISIHADFYPRSLLRKLHQKPSVFAWKQRPPWRGAFAFHL